MESSKLLSMRLSNEKNETKLTFIGEVIKSIRNERALKSGELAEKAQISKAYLSEIENSKKIPDLKVLARISLALDVPLSILLFKALNEESIEDGSKKRLIREIKPLFDKIVNILYFSEDEAGSDEENLEGIEAQKKELSY